MQDLLIIYSWKLTQKNIYSTQNKRNYGKYIISVLKLTYELSLNKKLPFLDVLLNNSNKLIKTKIYRKKTNKEQ